MAYRESIPLREISTSQLGISILDSLSLASIIGNAINFDADLKRSQEILTETNNYIKGAILSAAQGNSSLPTKTGRDLLKQAISELTTNLPFLNSRLENQAIQSSGGYRLSATMLGQQNKFWSAFHNIDFYSKILFDYPEAYAEKVIKRFYNGSFGLENPPERDQWIMYRNGKIKSTNLLDNLRMDGGFELQTAKNLMEIRDWQYGKPDPRTAWRWYRKGLVDIDYFYKVCQLGYGYSKAEADIILEDFDYDPTVSDVMNLAALVPIDSAWVDAAFDRAGFNETDKAVFKTALEKKTITQEIRSIWGSILTFYQYGQYTDEQITELLEGWLFNASEIAIKLETCQLYRAKFVSQLMRDAEIYLYRKAVLSEQDLYDRLLAMSISQDVANAITRNEAAKQGIDWELEE